MNKHSNHFVDFCLNNQFATTSFLDKTYTMNDMEIGIGIIKLNISDGLFFMVFSCPQEDSQNIFFAVSENDFEVCALCVAYCEYRTYGKQANIEEYVRFDQVFIPELKHIHGILLSMTEQMVILKEYPRVLNYQDKEYNTLFCIPCSDQDHEVLSRLGFMDGMLYFYDHHKNWADFNFHA